MFNVINDEQQKEKHAANQFFSRLLVGQYAPAKKMILFWRRGGRPRRTFCYGTFRVGSCNNLKTYPHRDGGHFS